jgi:hypothetical protein
MPNSAIFPRFIESRLKTAANEIADRFVNRDGKKRRHACGWPAIPHHVKCGSRPLGRLFPKGEKSNERAAKFRPLFIP